MANKVKIDGKEYDLESLGEETKAHIASIQSVDRRLRDLQEQVAILQTARVGYTNGLKAHLTKDTPEELN